MGAGVAAEDVAKHAVTRQEPRDFLGEHGSLRYFVNSRGFRVASYFWPATTTKAKGVVVAVHGHGSYLCFDYLKHQGPGLPHCYSGSWVEKLNARGFGVCGVDNHGCGRSQGLRGYVESFDHYVDDICTLTQWGMTLGIPGFEEGVPMFLLGESLGGCISVIAGMRKKGEYRGVILLAPMLSLAKLSRKGLNPYLRPFADWISWLVPTMRVAATNRNEVYPVLQQTHDLDPWTYSGKTRARNACEYLRVTEWLSGQLHAITFPFLCFHSENDTQCDVDGSKQLLLNAMSTDKKLRLVSTMWHMLVKEPGNEQILAEVLRWLEDRVSGDHVNTSTLFGG